MSTLAHAALPIVAALFDSLWEGALIAGAVWFGLRCLPMLGAATRYAIWLCALAALVFIPVLTVSLSVQRPEPAIAPAVAGEQRSASPETFAQPRTGAPRIAPEPAGSATEPAPVAPHKPRITVPQSLAIAIALIWLLVVCGRSVLLMLDVRALAAIRRESRLWSTSHEYPVLLSDRVPVPLAAGFRHAAIILPAALVEQLGADAVETIVVHEVAHLRRYDVWTNGLARLAEALLALNPAAWFVMRRLSMEREIACDD